LYIVTYLSLKSYKDIKYKNQIIISVFIGVLLYTLFISFFKIDLWYNTAFCYVFGCFYSLYKNEIENFIKDKRIILIFYFALLFVIAYKFRNNIIWYYVLSISFTSLIVLISSMFNIHNKVLEWFGKNLFPVYIFQRLPMLIIKNYPYFLNRRYLSLVICLFATICICIVYNFFNKYVLSKLYNKLFSKLERHQYKNVDAVVRKSF